MIFLKKIFGIVCIALLASLVTGCSDGKSVKKTKSVSSPPSETAAVTEEQEGTVPEADITTAAESPSLPADIEAAEGTYVYDTAKLFTAEQFKACNDYAEVLYERNLINAAVVTTDSLGGSTPEEFAAKKYTELYNGLGSGLLLLINNDTNSDYLYRSGSCGTYVTDDAVKQAMYYSTQDFVNGDWQSGALRLLQLGESCPSHVFDNVSALPSEMSADLEAALSGYKNDVSVLITSNNTDKTDDEVLTSYYERHYQDGKGAMIFLNTANGKISVKSGTDLPSDMEKAISEAETKAAGGDILSALKTVSDKLKG